MKILFVNALYPPNIIGGAERSVQILAESIASKGHEATVATTAEKDTAGLLNKVKVRYVRVPNLYWMYNAKQKAIWKKPFWHILDADNPFAEKKIRDILDEEKPNVVHTNNLSGFSVRMWRVAKKQGIPVVHTLRDCYLLCPYSTMFRNGRACSSQCFSCKVYSLPKKKASRTIDAVVGISRYILNMHLTNGFFKNARIKTKIFNAVEKAEPHRRRAGTKIRLGFVGLLSPEKGVEFMLDKLQNCMPDDTVIEIFGKGVTGKYDTFLKRRYKNSMVHFHGQRAQNEIFPNIDVLIVPSLWPEPFGRVVPEAFSYNVPVLASNRGGLPEIIEEGKNGYVFNPDIPGDFEKKLSRIMKDREKMNSFRQEIFSVERICCEYLELYSRVIRQKAF